MRTKYWIVIVTLLITCSFVICSCTKRESVSKAAGSLSIQIGPLSDVHFDNSKRSWVFDIPVILVNNGNKILYVPNPEFAFSSWGDLKFFLVNCDGISIEESPFEAVLIFGDYSWRKLKAGESIDFSKHIVVSQIEEMNVPFKASDLQNILFFSNSSLGDKYKIRAGQYKIFARFAYDNQRLEDRQWWLEQAHLPINDVELSRFWHGKIESNHLNLELKEEQR